MVIGESHKATKRVRMHRIRSRSFDSISGPEPEMQAVHISQSVGDTPGGMCTGKLAHRTIPDMRMLYMSGYLRWLSRNVIRSRRGLHHSSHIHTVQAAALHE